MVGELLDGCLLRSGADGVGEGVDLNDAGPGEAKVAGRGKKAGAAVAEGVAVLGCGDEGGAAGRRGVGELLDGEGIAGADERLDGRVEVEERNRGGGMGVMKLDVELGADEHATPVDSCCEMKMCSYVMQLAACSLARLAELEQPRAQIGVGVREDGATALARMLQ